MFAWTGSAWGSISSTAAIFRYRFTAAGGETSESGLDDNGITLSYIPGKEQVYLNGVLLVRTTDYTASDGTSITSLAALTAGDILEIITFTAFDLATAIDKALFDAKGDILVATAADTPGKLTVGTNGQVLKANSSTATGLEWGTIDLSTKQDVVSGVSDTEIGYLDGVTSAIQTQINSKIGQSTAINPAIVDAKGDIIAATAADTVARLAVGANDTVLTADSTAATGLKWATAASGSLTLLSTTTLSGASVTVSGISGSYANLYILVNGMTNATNNGHFRIAPNGSTTITGSSGVISNGSAQTDIGNYLRPAGGGPMLRTDSNNAAAITIFNYSGSISNKPFSSSFGYVEPANSWNVGAVFAGSIATGSAITSLVFSNSQGNLSTGTVRIYGVN
jgi:hypothetical protein